MKRVIVVLSLTLTVMLSLSWVSAENPYFIIYPKDVELNVPKGFPSPAYRFKNNQLTPAVFVLGRKLFYDPILSRDSSTSCGSCHQRIAAFAHIDHTLAHGIDGLKGKRNVPALQNLIWMDAFMADGGINHLEVQPLAPLTSPVEMGSDPKEILMKLNRQTYYRAYAFQAFGDSVLTSQIMLKALTQFVGLMISSNSRYDQFIRKEIAFDSVEMKGYQVFKSNCAVCHKEPLLTDNSYRQIGLRLDTMLLDSGRLKVTGNANDFMRFKVPGLRNIERTYPYMHDGRFRSLKEVIRYYANPSAFVGPVDPMLKYMKPMNEQEQAALMAFMKTLTDNTFLYDRRFADPGIN